jgi:hypothetical protein
MAIATMTDIPPPTHLPTHAPSRMSARTHTPACPPTHLPARTPSCMLTRMRRQCVNTTATVCHIFFLFFSCFRYCLQALLWYADQSQDGRGTRKRRSKRGRARHRAAHDTRNCGITQGGRRQRSCGMTGDRGTTGRSMTHDGEQQIT